MSINAGTVVSYMELDTSKFKAGLSGAMDQLKVFRNDSATTGDKLIGLGNASKGVGSTLTKGLTVPILGAGAVAFKMASDMEESTNKVNVAFGKSAEKIDEWSNTALGSYGIAKGTALDMSSLFGDMATSMGLPQKEAANMSMSLVGLAGDLSSFKNINIKEAETALNGIFTGETESLKRLGVVMTETNLQQYAYSQGIKKKVKEMTESEKVQLRYNYVLDKTKNAHGDFARTNDGAANQTRMFTEGLKELGAGFGQHVLPMVTPVITKINEGIKAFGQMDEGKKKLIITIALMVAAVGPLLMGLGNLLIFVGSVSTALTTFGGVAGIASAASTALGTAITFLTGPIGLTIIAITAIIAIGVLLYKNWDTVSAKAKELGNKIQESWQTLKNNTQKLWNDIKTGIVNKANEIKTYAVYKFFEMKTNITNTVNQAKTAIVNKFNELKTNSVNKVRELASSAPGVLRSLPGRFLSIGKDVIQGLINGIKSKARAVTRAISDVASAMTNKVKGLLGIKSPSRVFMGFGTNIGEGLAIGIDGMNKDVKESVSKLSENAMPNMNTLDIERSVKTNFIQNPLNSSSGSSNSGLNFNFNVENLSVRNDHDIDKLTKAIDIKLKDFANRVNLTKGGGRVAY